jgi:hypothetical protein
MPSLALLVAAFALSGPAAPLAPTVGPYDPKGSGLYVAIQYVPPLRHCSVRTKLCVSICIPRRKVCPLTRHLRQLRHS